MSAATGPRMLRIAGNEAWTQLLSLWRMPSFVLPALLFPTAFYAFFALVLPPADQVSARALSMLASYGVFGAIGPALFGFGVGVASERESGWLELRRASPMPAWAYFFGKIAMSLVFALAIVLALGALALGFGGVRIAPGRAALVVATLLAGTLPFCALGLLIGVSVRAQAAAGVVNLVYMPMAVLSGLWFPLTMLPDPLQRLAVVWPAWHAAQLALGALGQAEEVAWPLHVLALAGFSAVFLLVAALRLGAGGRR